MSYSFGLNHLLELGVIVLFAILQITAAVILFRDRGFACWMMLIGSILSGGLDLVSRILYLLRLSDSLELDLATVMRQLEIFGMIANFGRFLFSAGLIFYALRRRTLSARTAELEQIIAAKNSRLQ